ncbi:MAG: hypothetical protein ACJAVK_000781 [Akkermansiaceae bacterium]|jgi:hypothetical protein
MIGLPTNFLFFQVSLLTSISDLVTGNFFGPIAKSMWLVILAGARF